MDAMAFVLLLGLHSYMTLQRFSDTVQGYEIVLAIWFIALAVEEVRQVRCAHQQTSESDCVFLSLHLKT
jgi:hypothetical protein